MTTFIAVNDHTTPPTWRIISGNAAVRAAEGRGEYVIEYTADSLLHLAESKQFSRPVLESLIEHRPDDELPMIRAALREARRYG